MAAILSSILEDDQVLPIFPPLNNASNITSLITEDAPINANTELSASHIATPELLNEIQAIQDAMLNNEDFDFSSLEATAAGNTENTESESSDKSSNIPILLEDEGIQINYRGGVESITSTEDLNLGSQQTTQDIQELPTLFSQNTTNAIDSSVSEDFNTQTQGKLKSNLGIDAQTIESSYGLLTINENGQWFYNLNNQAQDIQQLSAGDTLNDLISVTSRIGQSTQISIQINGTNDQALISGAKQAEIQAEKLESLSNELPSVSGKLEVSDIDFGESRFETNFDIKGSFGVAQINALGEWSYTLNNHADAIQGLRSGEKLLDLFSIKTLDGTKQLIQISISGTDDKPILGGKNFSLLDLDTNVSTNGSLSINDPDFGESSFQALSNIKSSLGFGFAEIDNQGHWTFTLDKDFISNNPIGEDQTRIDSFEVFTFDGTSQTIHIPIKGSNSPLYAESDTASNNADVLTLSDLLINESNQGDIIFDQNNQALDLVTSESDLQLEQVQSMMFMNTELDVLNNISSQLNDVTIS